MKIKTLNNTKYVDDVVNIHMQTFSGFFLTFLGKGFLRELYKGFIRHDKSNIIGIFDDNDKLLGFLAYSKDISKFYKYLVKKNLRSFAWYGFLAFLKKPKIMLRLIRAFKYSDDSKRNEQYIELSSIGVLPDAKNKGIGSKLINMLKSMYEGREYEYIKLETDKLNNDAVNKFYLKNGFELNNSYCTHEGREMNEYRYYLSNIDNRMLNENTNI
ncbi:MAG: GNAT family N-acetyltransferase [Armatimonadota bacterium]